MEPSNDGGVRSTRSARARRVDRRDDIIDAAAKLFREQGFHAVGMGAIGEAVGVTGPAVYRHFPGKEAILVSAVRSAVDQVARASQRVRAEGLDPHASLEQIVSETVRLNLEWRELYSVYMREYFNLPPEERERLREDAEAGSRIAAAYLEVVRPDLPPGGSRFRVDVSAGLLMGFNLHEGLVSRSRVAHRMRTMLRAALTTDVEEERALRSETAAVDEPLDTEVMGWISRREHLLRVAAKLLRRHGYAGVGIDDVGVAVGISGPAVYRHFESKLDLVTAVVRRAGEQLQAQAATGLGSADDADTALRSLAAAHAQIAAQCHDAVISYLYDLGQLPLSAGDPVVRGRDAYLADWTRVLLACRPGLDAAEARTMVSGALGLLTQPFGGRRPLSAREWQTVTQMAVGALLAE